MKNEAIPKYIDNISKKNKFARMFWAIVSFFLFRAFGTRFFNGWRVFLLRLFGAKIGKGSVIYSSVRILAPWNLEIGDRTCIGPGVKFHIGKVMIGSGVTISQWAYLCTGSHDIHSVNKPFISKPIIIKDFAWIAAEAFIMMGVTIGEGAVVGARAAVFKDVEPWTVVGGNPAGFIKKREIIE
jgi:putative colanic acid biosynthesis acetyltransferase WcaF